MLSIRVTFCIAGRADYIEGILERIPGRACEGFCLNACPAFPGHAEVPRTLEGGPISPACSCGRLCGVSVSEIVLRARARDCRGSSSGRAMMKHLSHSVLPPLAAVALCASSPSARGGGMND